MTVEELQKYKHVQSIARETIEFLKSFIKEGVSAKEVKDAAENFMRERNVDLFWYHNVGALVLVGEETTISISGREYEPSDTKLRSNDLVTIDLAPAVDNFWGDFARSLIVENGKVVEPENSRSTEMVEGIKAEEKIDKHFQDSLGGEVSFGEAYEKMNSFIEDLGYENLDFRKNLGHSIAERREDRIWMEAGNGLKLKDVPVFTFEPHIKRKGGKYGFKHEDIYHFDKGKLEVL